MASGCPLRPPHGPKPRTVGTQLDRSVCGVRVASRIRRSGDRRDEKRPRFSRLAWQIPRCDSPAFRLRSRAAGSTRSPDDGVLLDRPSRRGHPHPQGWFTGVPQVSSPASSDSTAPLTWGVGAPRCASAAPIPPVALLGVQLHELAGLRERLVGRLRETLLDQPKGSQDGDQKATQAARAPSSPKLNWPIRSDRWQVQSCPARTRIYQQGWPCATCVSFRAFEPAQLRKDRLFGSDAFTITVACPAVTRARAGPPAAVCRH